MCASALFAAFACVCASALFAAFASREGDDDEEAEEEEDVEEENGRGNNTRRSSMRESYKLVSTLLIYSLKAETLGITDGSKATASSAAEIEPNALSQR